MIYRSTKVDDESEEEEEEEEEVQNRLLTVASKVSLAAC